MTKESHCRLVLQHMKTYGSINPIEAENQYGRSDDRHGVTVQEWISVKDRLPEDGQIVLTYKNGICDIQTYEARRNGWLCKGWFWSMATVTHWMPLPQPPKGE